MTRPEGIIEPLTIQSYLAEHVAGWADIEVDSVEVVGEGWESEILGLACRTSEGPIALVLRMYTGAGGSDKAALEGDGMPRLHSSGYPVPQVFHTETSPDPLGLPFIVMERAPGIELWKHLQPATGQVARNLEHEFIDLLVELHRTPTTAFQIADTPTDAHHFVRSTLAMWKGIAGIGPPDVALAIDWFDQEVAGIEPLPPSVTHNDFHPGNILRDDTGKMTVIDWTGLGVSDPRFDLAWTLLLRETYGAPGAAHRERERYGSQLPIPDLEFFEAAARLRRLFSLVVSLTAGPEALGMRAGVESQMRQELERSAASHERFAEITGLRLDSFEQLATTMGRPE